MWVDYYLFADSTWYSCRAVQDGQCPRCRDADALGGIETNTMTNRFYGFLSSVLIYNVQLV
jgi:hypothetical protein